MQLQRNLDRVGPQGLRRPDRHPLGRLGQRAGPLDDADVVQLGLGDEQASRGPEGTGLVHQAGDVGLAQLGNPDRHDQHGAERVLPQDLAP